MSIFALSIFLSAFLLFLVQPMIGRYILPWFGSTPGVWTVCLLFFQLLLLLGYAYAHLIVSRLKPRTQALTHLALLVFVLLTMPITPAESLKPETGDSPVLKILQLLLVTVGAPFLVLSATGPLIQGWFSRVHPGRSPYRLYALSNFGSLLALISYPFLFERFLTLNQQTFGWSACWVVFALLVGICAWRLRRTDDAPEAGAGDGDAPDVARPGLKSIALWIALAGCGSALLMATTNRLCLDVAVFPFLWVLPLALYLVTFIIAFDHDRWYARPVFLMLLPASLFLAVYAVIKGPGLAVFPQIAIGGFTLFVCCMCCHGELVRRKPHPRHLTIFYLAVAAGGALGGLFVAIFSPLLFTGLFEYHLLLLATYVLVVGIVAHELFHSRVLVSQVGAARIGALAAWGVFAASIVVLVIVFLDPTAWPKRQMDSRSGAVFRSLLRNSRYVVIMVPLVLVLGLGGVRVWSREYLANWRTPQRLAILFLLAICCVGAVPLLGTLTLDFIRNRSLVVARDRNFYGVLTIRDLGKGGPRHRHSLLHGRIEHGIQFKDSERSAWPTTYFGPRSGVGVAIRFHPHRVKANRQFRIGVVGLGTGTLAAYGNSTVLPEFEESAPYVEEARRSPGDYVAFYEINPMDIDWAEHRFTYLQDARDRGAEVVVFPGDARIVMERQIEAERRQRFDVLVIDAFSGDGIPVHLLTTECFEVYKEHLAEDGVLAVHITNRHFGLAPIVRRLARHAGFSAVFVAKGDEPELGLNASDWVLLSNNPDFLNDAGLRAARDDWPISGPLWTDNFSSIFSVLK